MSLRIVIDARRIRDFGIGTYIRNLVRALAVIDRENRYVLTAAAADTEELAGLPGNFSTAVYNRPDTSAADQIAFPLFLRQFSADLYHIPLNAVALFMPKPYVVTIHDMSTLLFGPVPRLRHAWRLYLFRRGLFRAARVIAVSAATRRDVETVLGVPADRIHQIYDAPDPRFLKTCGEETDEALVERRRVLERYQVTYPYILYAGTIRPQKNIPRLVEAFAVLRGDLESHPVYKDLRLIIIGDEISRHPSVRRAVIRTRVEDVVRFLGFVPFDALRVFYEAAAAFAFPSLYEGFGLPPLEAMASGTPVVTSDVSSLPEVAGNAAVLVNPENVFDIARGLRETLLNTDLRRELIRRGYEQVRRFSWQDAARQVLEIYLEVARGRRSAGASNPPVPRG
ncbi:MAG: glycosyltransferase family 1 protein [Acidobacteriota bacterium]